MIFMFYGIYNQLNKKIQRKKESIGNLDETVKKKEPE